MLEFVVEILQYFRVSGKENAAIEPMNRMRMRLLGETVEYCGISTA